MELLYFNEVKADSLKGIILPSFVWIALYNLTSIIKHPLYG